MKARSQTGRDRSQVGVVIATRNRRSDLMRALEHLTALPEEPPIAVVDNGSVDGTAEAVAASYPSVRLLRLEQNRGAAARNIGAAALGTPFVAFSDDDSWWQPGSLAGAAGTFGRFPRLGLIAARILVGAERRLDPTSAEMRGETPAGLPGPRVSGFVACGAVVRYRAFVEAGGFCERFLIGGEEMLLSLDMSSAGWELCYLDELVAVHVPNAGDRGDRSWLKTRNALWTSWMRMPLERAVRETVSVARAARDDPAARRALASGLRGLPWALSKRRARVNGGGSTQTRRA